MTKKGAFSSCGVSRPWSWVCRHHQTGHVLVREIRRDASLPGRVCLVHWVGHHACEKVVGVGKQSSLNPW